MRFISPLRYPGGKAKLAPYIASLINAQQIPPRYYAEPFAGGAGAALKLLHEGIIEHIYLNDLNPGIAAFWRAITQTPEEFNHLITTCELNIDAWKHYKNIYDTPQNKDDLTLGFATFYLNRTCRSGILGARPIGGMEQTGKWKIDARFNRDNLSHRIRTIAAMADNITITESESIDFLTTMEEHGGNIFVYADPPYLGQGEGLYLHAFDEPLHHRRPLRFRPSSNLPHRPHSSPPTRWRRINHLLKQPHHPQPTSHQKTHRTMGTQHHPTRTHSFLTPTSDYFSRNPTKKA